MADIKPGDEIEYTTLGDKPGKYVVQGPSQDRNPGVILKGTNNNRVFAVSGDGMKRIKGYNPPVGPSTNPTKYTPPPSSNPPNYTFPPVTKKQYVPPTIIKSTSPIVNMSNTSPPPKTPSNKQQSDSNPKDNNTKKDSKDSDKSDKGFKKKDLGIAAAAGAASGAALNSLRNAGRSIGGPGSGSGSGSSESDYSFGFVMLFFLAIITQVIDLATHYQRPGGFMIYAVVVLLVIAFFVFDMSFDSRITTFAIVLLIAYFFPYIGTLLPDSRATLLANGLLFYLPVIVLYLGLKFPKRTVPRFLAILILVIWILAVAFNLIASFTPDMNTKTLVKDPMAGARYATSFLIKSFSKVGTSIANAFDRAVAEATGEPYGGEQESRVGIYVENIKGIESRYTNMSNVYVEATIKAENLKESVDVNTICYIDNIGPGLASPTMMYNVTDDYENIVSCNFGRLSQGVYVIHVRINFQFETSSDIKYTFVNSGIRSNQYEKLNIDPETVATYTGGPVELGLPALTQPLRVDVKPGTNTQLSTYPFGVSLRNLWPQGQVIKGIRYMLDVPTEINLVDCSRNFTTESGQNASNGRNIYYFDVDKENARDKFDAIQCRMDINNVISLMGADLKSERTFAARVRYEYAVEGITTIIVEPN